MYNWLSTKSRVFKRTCVTLRHFKSLKFLLVSDLPKRPHLEANEINSIFIWPSKLNKKQTNHPLNYFCKYHNWTLLIVTIQLFIPAKRFSSEKKHPYSLLLQLRSRYVCAICRYIKCVFKRCGKDMETSVVENCFVKWKMIVALVFK